MSTKEQEKIIQQLRDKAIKVEFSEKPKGSYKLDKNAVWEKAKKAGKTISDDNLPAPNPSAA